MTNLFLQTSGILLPIVIYQMLWNRSLLRPSSFTGKIIFVGFLAASMLVCMSFAVPLEGFHIDMRDVPLMLSFLYGTNDIALLLTVLSVGYRFYIGGMLGIRGSVAALVVHVIVLAVVIWVCRRYENLTHERRIQVATTLGALLGVVATGVSIAFAPTIVHVPHIGPFYMFFIAANMFGMMAVVWLVEKSRERDQLMRQVQEGEKLQVVSDLAASIAHEVRNPLTVISGFVQLLLQGDVEGDKKALYGQFIMSEMARAQTIIDDYLTFARPDVDVREVVHLEIRSQMLAAIQLMQPFATSHNVEFDVDLAADLYVNMQREKFTQVIVNLLKNAIESMPNGGIVTIHTSQGQGQISIDMIDQGIGMSAQQMERLGYPFYTMKDRGTGLGLMVSYRIVESIGGKVSVASEFGKGTHFTIHLPTVVPQISPAHSGANLEAAHGTISSEIL